MRLDLHVHTSASDGAWTPEQVVDGAVSGRLDVLAIADHDTTAGLEDARHAVRGRNLQVVPACELSSTWEGRELHFLGYFVDPEATALERFEDRAERLRQSRMERMVERLRREGVEVAMEAVLEVAGPRRSTLARPHLARVLVQEGYVESVPEAFERYIGDGHTAYLPTQLADPAETIQTIRNAGGIAIWAHPPVELLDGLLPALVRSGLEGLEVYRPRSHPNQVRRLERVARAAGLFLSGGSDWHDPERNEALGDFYVTPSEVGDLLNAGGL